MTDTPTDDTLRDELAATLHERGCDQGGCPGVCLEDADALLPVVRRHIEQARADEREAAARRVWSAYGGCCRPYHKRETCPYDQHAIGIMRVALGAEHYDAFAPEIEAAIGRIIAEQDHRRAAADELSRLGQEIDT